MRQAFTLVLLLLWPYFGVAAPLRVQTGEHADFTRVVIGLPQGVDWQVGRIPEGYAIRVPTTEGFRLNQFFNMIPRDRIADIAQTPSEGELRLSINCNCHATAEIFRSNFLVVDIRDGPAPPNSIFEAALLTAETVPPNALVPAIVGQPYRPAQRRLLPLITPRFQPSETEAPPPDALTQEDELSPVPAQSTADALQVIAQALTASVGRGLSEGLLQEGLSAASERATETDASRTGQLQEDLAFPGVSARTSIDPLAVANAAAPPETQVGQSCLPDALFNVTSWGNDDPPDRQLQAARSGLAAEDDRFADEALVTLARLYVFLGFGREAQQALALEGAQSRDRMILRGIAQIIDDEPVAFEVFAGQVSCPTNAALWALLAQPVAPTDAEVDRAAVVNAYRALPVYVQQTIAPRLTEALLAIGAEDAALQVLERQTSGQTGGVSRALAEVSLADALGEGAQAMDQIQDIARNDPRTSPEAMARFFRDGASREIAFSDEDFLLADALRFENTGTIAADVLADAQFAGYLSVDRFEEARSLLRDRRSALSTDAFLTGQDTVYQQAAEGMADAAFLEFVWDEDLSTQNAQTQNMVANRLMELGFPDRALGLLTGPATGEVVAQQDMLTGQALQSIAAIAATRAGIATQTTPTDPPLVDFDGDGAPFRMPIDRLTLRDGRALIDTAEQSRESIRALLQSVPAPSDF